MQSLNRPRVLLIAETANPEWRSVALVGWSHSQAIATLADAHIVTQSFNRQGFLKAGCVEGKDFSVIDTSAVLQPILKIASLLRGGENKGWTTLMAFSIFPYYYFEKLVWQQFGSQIADRQFDIVHRLTPLSPTIPSLLAHKCHQVGVPFILGPLNGGLPWPKEFESARQQEKEWLSYIRWIYRLVPGYRSTRRCASAIIVGSRDTWQQMPRQYHHKCIYIPENAIDPQRFNKNQTRSTGSQPLKVIFVGRLVPYKGADMLIEAAVPLVKDGVLTVDIVGNGPEMPKLKALVEQEGITHGVQFFGDVEPNQVQDYLMNAEVFAFPSIREFGGAVVIEAMVMGLVPIVIDYGGPGELVSQSTGYKVPMGSRQAIVAAFRELLGRLSLNRDQLATMGEHARKRVLSQLTWHAKAQQTFEVYKWVLGHRADKPDFGMPLTDLEN